jgi:hypothetical protein
MLPKPRQLLPRIFHRNKPLHIQALISQPTVETLDESVLHRPAGPNEAQLYASPFLSAVSPDGHYLAIADYTMDRNLWMMENF